MEQSSLTFFRIHVVHQAACTNRVGNTFSFIGQAIKRDFIRGEHYIVQEFLSSPLFDATFMDFSKR